MRLTGKTAIVTGTSSVMGSAIAAIYAKEGANVLAVEKTSKSSRMSLRTAAIKIVPFLA